LHGRDLRRDLAGRLDGVPAYDDARLTAELDLFPAWWARHALGSGNGPDAAFARAFHDHWRPLLPAVRDVPETLVLRDYHVDNLRMIDRPGLSGVGLLDFQDAVRGPVAYDLVSLVYDARRDIAPALAQRMLARYVAAFPALDPQKFAAACAILSAQRNLK